MDATKSQTKKVWGFFGNNPAALVIEFFIMNPDEEFTITQIVEGSGIARTTLWDNVLKRLLDEGIIVKSREIGNAKLYVLNRNSKRVVYLVDFYNKLREEKNA